MRPRAIHNSTSFIQSLAQLCCCLIASAVPAVADDNSIYLQQIKPVLQARCYACHGALKQESGLRLDTAALVRKGGETGPVVTPAEVDKSTLLQRITSTDDAVRMPPDGEPLKPAEVAALKNWIAGGAIGPADESPERDPADHWAFRPPTRPQVPRVANSVWSANPIDAFIADAHQRHDLKPQPPASKSLWLRRVTLDLIGLPPTREELESFLSDDSAEAVDRVVSRLLESPHYGERWGRHWMDIWRYSDWWGLGEESRNSQRHIWHWRDWVVESMNADKGYDQMLREMLAADELYPDDPDRLRAGGFLGRQYFKFNRTSWLDETIEHTAKAMIGLTFNCAKCHDHKYDPFTQADYYRFRAIFEPYQVRLDAIDGQIDFDKDGLPRPFDCNLDAKTYLHIRGDDRNPDTSRVMEPAVPAFLSQQPITIEAIGLPPLAIQPGIRPIVVQSHLKQATQRLAEKQSELAAARKRLVEVVAIAEGRAPVSALSAVNATDSGKSAQLPWTVEQAKLAVTAAEKTLVWAESQPDYVRAVAAADWARHQQPPADNASDLTRAAAKLERAAAVLKAEETVARQELELARAATDKKAEIEGRLTKSREALEPARKAALEPGETFTSLRGASKVLESNLETEESRTKPFPATSTGRRTALAKWITDPRHPLTARVAVNHLWSRHFGRPLVQSVFDFGRKGALPSHPELLDWLALEMIEGGGDPARSPPWGMKHLHRLIVTSMTYRLASTNADAAPQNLAVDPENKFYWRMNPIRMQSQAVRDSLLQLAGELDPTLGGPTIPIGNELSRRRSIYFFHSNIQREKFLSTFDDASVLDCYRRAESIVPQQALALENSQLANEMAKKIAQRLSDAFPQASDVEFVRIAFLAILSTEASAVEQSTAAAAVEQFRQAAKASNRDNPDQHARIGLVQALLNHNDFVTIR